MHLDFFDQQVDVVDCMFGFTPPLERICLIFLETIETNKLPKRCP